MTYNVFGGTLNLAQSTAIGNMHRKFGEFGHVVPDICMLTDIQITDRQTGAHWNTLLPYYTHTHNCFTALLDFVRDNPDEPAPER